MIWFVVFVAILLMLIYAGYCDSVYRYKQRRQEKEIQQEQENIEVLPIRDYDNLFAMIKTMMLDIADMREIKVLIDKNAEVESSILDYDNDYISDKYLNIWYDKLKAKLDLNWTFFCDVYGIYEKLIPSRSRYVIDTYRDYIKAFVEGRVNDI